MAGRAAWAPNHVGGKRGWRAGRCSVRWRVQAGGEWPGRAGAGASAGQFPERTTGAPWWPAPQIAGTRRLLPAKERCSGASRAHRAMSAPSP